MKLFYSCSFSSQIDDNTGLVSESYQRLISDDLRRLRNAGHEVFCAIEAEGWRMGDLTPGDGVRWDIDELNRTEAVIARVTNTPSAGVQWEMGYASGQGKPVYLIVEDGTGYWNTGLIEAGAVKIIDKEFAL